MLRLARWTALKDYRESCISDRSIGLSSAACNATLLSPVRAPPVRKRATPVPMFDVRDRAITFTAGIMAGIALSVAAATIVRSYFDMRPRPVISFARANPHCPTALLEVPGRRFELGSTRLISAIDESSHTCVSSDDSDDNSVWNGHGSHASLRHQEILEHSESEAEIQRAFEKSNSSDADDSDSSVHLVVRDVDEPIDSSSAQNARGGILKTAYLSLPELPGA